MSTTSVDYISPDCLDLVVNDSNFDLKVLDYIPIVSTASGITRFAFGIFQEISGLVEELVELMQFCLHPRQAVSLQSSDLYLHGKANMIRGSIAITPIFGNITLYLYDNSHFAKSWKERTAILTIF